MSGRKRGKTRKGKERSRSKIAARIFGNWGVSFFSPLISGNVAEVYYDVGLSFEQTVFISLLSSIFVTGLSLFTEIKEYGEN